MPGPIEGGVEVAKTTVDALKTSPALLGIIISQIIMIGILAYVAHERNIYETNVHKEYADHIELLIKQCALRNDRGELIPLPLPFPSGVPRG